MNEMINRLSSVPVEEVLRSAMSRHHWLDLFIYFALNFALVLLLTFNDAKKPENDGVNGRNRDCAVKNSD